MLFQPVRRDADAARPHRRTVRERADGVGTERLCRDAGGRFAAAGFRSGGGGRSGCREIPVGCPIRRPKRLFIVSGYCKTTHYPPPKTLSLSGEGNAVEIGMESGYAR